MCEWCDPAVNIGGYTLRSGYSHHDTVAKTHFGAVSFGMVFGDWANGCQILPDVTLPTNKQSALTTALVNPTSAAVTDIGGRTSNAITAVKVGTDANQGIEEAYAWYHADTATCTTVSSGTCSHTPAELADTLGGAFRWGLLAPRPRVTSRPLATTPQKAELPLSADPGCKRVSSKKSAM